MKGSTLLKVTSILSIIGGAIGLIVGAIAAFSAAILIEMGAPALYVVACILVVVAAIVELIAGIIGVVNCTKPEKAQSCIVIGIIVIALSLLGNILTIACGGEFDVVSLLTGLVIPVLYLIGAIQLKSNLNAPAEEAAPAEENTEALFINCLST